jgi:cephalosporin hydroxylase
MAEFISIDVEAKPGRPQHPRLTYLTGLSADKTVVAQVRETVGAQRAKVILDSDRHAARVYTRPSPTARLFRSATTSSSKTPM